MAPNGERVRERVGEDADVERVGEYRGEGRERGGSSVAERLYEHQPDRKIEHRHE